jgi:hypothetical protein
VRINRATTRVAQDRSFAVERSPDAGPLKVHLADDLAGVGSRPSSGTQGWRNTPPMMSAATAINADSFGTSILVPAQRS